jgi:hypothetical protein
MRDEDDDHYEVEVSSGINKIVNKLNKNFLERFSSLG